MDREERTVRPEAGRPVGRSQITAATEQEHFNHCSDRMEMRGNICKLGRQYKISTTEYSGLGRRNSSNF